MLNLKQKLNFTRHCKLNSLIRIDPGHFPLAIIIDVWVIKQLAYFSLLYLLESSTDLKKYKYVKSIVIGQTVELWSLTGENCN